MARIALSPIAPTSSGTALTYSAVSAAAAPDGNLFAFDGSAVLLVNNASGGSINLTVDVPLAVDGVAVADRVIACPAGAVTVFKPNAAHRQPDGTVHINFSSATSVTAAVLNV